MTKKKKVIFQDKEALEAYLSHFYLFITKRSWVDMKGFYKQIRLFIDNYPNLDKIDNQD